MQPSDQQNKDKVPDQSEESKDQGVQEEVKDYAEASQKDTRQGSSRSLRKIDRQNDVLNMDATQVAKDETGSSNEKKPSQSSFTNLENEPLGSEASGKKNLIDPEPNKGDDVVAVSIMNSGNSVATAASNETGNAGEKGQQGIFPKIETEDSQFQLDKKIRISAIKKKTAQKGKPKRSTQNTGSNQEVNRGKGERWFIGNGVPVDKRKHKKIPGWAYNEDGKYKSPTITASDPRLNDIPQDRLPKFDKILKKLPKRRGIARRDMLNFEPTLRKNRLFKRTKFKAIRFGENRSVQFFEAVKVPQGEAHEMDRFLEAFITTVQEDPEQVIISRANAIRDWVLNSPIPYKCHARHKKWKEAMRSGISQDELDVPAFAKYTLDEDEDLVPIEFLDITRRFSSVTQKGVENIDESQNDPPRRIREYSYDSSSSEESNEIERHIITQKGRAQAPYWFFRSNSNSSVLSQYRYLDRMFPFDIGNRENAHNVYLSRNEDLLPLSNDLAFFEECQIRVGDIIVGYSLEQLEVEEVARGQFSNILKDMDKGGEGIPLLITYLHQQYGLREQCEDENFWRKENYVGFGGYIRRQYILHTLANVWTFPSEYTSLKVLDSDKDGEMNFPADFLSSPSYMLSNDDLFGPSSPLYFKGNVTYVLLYDKGAGVNKANRTDLDVLGIVTKMEETELVRTSGYVNYKKERVIAHREAMVKKVHNMRYAARNNDKDPEAHYLPDMKEQEEKARVPNVNRIARGIRRASFSAHSDYSSSDSEDSILSEYASDVDAVVSDPFSRKGVDLQEEVERLRKDPETAVFFHRDELSNTTCSECCCKCIGRHLFSIILLLLTVFCLIIQYYLDPSVSNSEAFTEDNAEYLNNIRFLMVGGALFFFALALLFYFLKEFKEKHLIDGKSQFIEIAPSAKDFVVANHDILEDIKDRRIGMSSIEATRIRRNHKIIVLITNFISGHEAHHAIDTPHTVQNTIGNITRIADATFYVKMEKFKPLQQFIFEKSNKFLDPEVDKSWGSIRISAVQEINDKPFHVDDAVHFAYDNDLTLKKIIKTQEVVSTGISLPSITSRCMRFLRHPLIKYFAALSSFAWIGFSMKLILEWQPQGFQNLALLSLPALTGCWENPLSILVGLYFSMHYGASGGLVGKMMVSGYKNSWTQGLVIQIYSLIVTLCPMWFRFIFPSDSGDLNDIEQAAAFAVVGLSVFSLLPVVASFTRKYCLEGLEVLSTSCVFKFLVSYYYSIEWLSLRTETCFFLADLTSGDNRLLLAELADLTKIFSRSETEQRRDKNVYGIAATTGIRGKDASWGLIDKKTKDEALLSPIDPGFKDFSFPASGVSVLSAVYYAESFYRSSVVGKRHTSFERLKAAGARVEAKNEVEMEIMMSEERYRDLNNPDMANRMPSPRDANAYKPHGANPLFILFWHSGLVLGVFIENLLYLPIFALYLVVHLVCAAALGALLSPVGVLYALHEVGYLLFAPQALKLQHPNNILLQLVAVYACLCLLVYHVLLFWVKMMITSFLAAFKLSLATLLCKKIQYFVTPRIPLYFLPALSTTDIDREGNIKKKRLFRGSEGGSWVGPVPYFAETPLYPKTQALSLAYADARVSADVVVRGKVRSNRKVEVGYIDEELLSEVGLTR